jgi:hypothetical protein
VDRDASVQVLMDLHRHARQRMAPPSLLDLKHPVVQVHRVVLVDHAFLLQAENVIQILAPHRNKRAPPLRGSHAKPLVEFLHIVAEKFIGFLQLGNPAQRSSWGSRPCQVPKLRSDRPRACGE